jgi:hypothetical protein
MLGSSLASYNQIHSCGRKSIGYLPTTAYFCPYADF